jgi:transcriptional regulator with GAF, ATPase, and Fis domain/serine/threonine protein kinase/tetratricopeptide (TPR) repeat protein
MHLAQKQFREDAVVGGHYSVARFLGAGDRSCSYLCRDLMGGGKRVVIKILSRENCSPEPASTSSERFSLLRRLRHPNLAHILDFGVLEESRDIFLAREWIQGKDLYSGTEGMEIEQILVWVLDIARALHYLHSRGMIHGNLKPSSVILSEESDPRVRVTDFGCFNNTQTARQGKGILPYVAPEIFLGGMQNKSSDFYALGIMFYQVLARHLPFEDEDPGFLIQQHLQGSVDLRSIERMRGGSRLSQLLRSLLDKDPAKRPATGEDIVRLIGKDLNRDHSIVDIKELETHFSASQFVGREKEMSRLKEGMNCMRENARGRTFFITGEAGSGKTRCMEELKSWSLLEGYQVVEGTCRAREEGSYSPYRQILANIDPVDGEPLFHFDNIQRMPGVFESFSEHAAGQFRDRLTRELVRRLDGRATLLLLDDFHLADEATIAVLDYLSSDIQSHQVLMCVGLRSGDEIRDVMERVMHSVIRQERGEILALEALTKGSVEILVERMTGDARLRTSLGPWIYKRFGGNPFFLEEVLKHLVEQRLLIREYGKWKFLSEDIGELEIPASVGAVLRKRLEQLPSSARELANWLGLFQGAVPIALLDAAIARDPIVMAEALKELDQRQMIQVETAGRDTTVEFRHSLIAEVIRGDLPQIRRQRMHRRIAEALEKTYGAESCLQELALHYIEGKSGRRAIRYALAAAAQSRAEFAHENALRCFEFIFKCRDGLTEEQRCTAAIEASDTMLALGLSKRSIYLLKKEIAGCKNIGAELKARMFMQLALSYQHLGDLRMQEKYCKEGLEFLRDRPSTEINVTKAMLWAELAFAAILQSHSREGLAYLDRARRACPDRDAEALKGRICNLSASLYRIAGKLHEALAASENAAEILGATNESYLACSAYSMLGHINAILGRFSPALQKHAQAVFLSEKSRSVVLRSQALANLAECLCRMGRILEASNAAEKASKSVREANNPAINYAFNSILAEIKIAAGDYRGAYQVVKNLDQDAKHNQAIYIVGHALFVAAYFSFILGDFDEALERIDKLRRLINREAPFYELELAEALKARILFERGHAQKALALLRSLERAVIRKKWPYQECSLKLHLCEILIRQGRMDLAEQHACDALNLAEAMESASLLSHSRLLLGLIYSPILDFNNPIYGGEGLTLSGKALSKAEAAVEQLQQACQIAENANLLETAWRAHAELCRILRLMPGATRYREHAQKSYELLCKIEEQVPSEMLPLYCGAFGRGRSKADLVRLIESGRDQESNSDIAVADIRDDEKARILLRVSATVNSIGELGPLLESILDQLIHAVRVERAMVFLRDELTGSLQFAKGRNSRHESLTVAEKLDRNILAEVMRQAQPLVSANTQEDPRLLHKGLINSFASRKLLCAPLKLSDRVLGVLYADHSSPAGTISEFAISLFAAFCNLAAIAIDNALAHQKLVKEKTELERYVHQARESFEEIIGKSESMELLRDRIELAANSPMDILITGESGTGKELIAKAIHRAGKRKSGKFTAVDCGSLADSLAEAELFGFRKGAFTGAGENRQGLIESANGGILFLDEISNMPFHLQAKLLRVIQEREVRRLGETTPRKVDFQLVAATNRGLLEEVRDGQFRADLYYRLRAFEIRVPPLRDRSEDIPLLIEWFLEESAGPASQRSRTFLPEALELLKRYPYPGNIRELRNIVIEAYYSTRKTKIGIRELPPEVRSEACAPLMPESSEAATIYREILEGRGDFDSLVKKPFLSHQFGQRVVRDVVRLSLKDSGGSYRDAFLLLRVPHTRYYVALQFLKRYNCFLDFRPFRRKR